MLSHLTLFTFFLHCLGSPSRATLTTQQCHIETPPKLYFNIIVPYQLPLTLKHVAVRLPRNTHEFSDFSQCEYFFSTNTNVFTVQHTNTGHSAWEDQMHQCANICHMALPAGASQCQYENSGTPAALICHAHNEILALGIPRYTSGQLVRIASFLGKLHFWKSKNSEIQKNDTQK